MLSGRVRLAFVAAVTLAVSCLSATPSFAGDGTGGVQCDKNHPKPGCSVEAGTGAQPGSTTGASNGGGSGGQNGDGKCRNPQGQVIPCERDGGWAGADGCYYKPVDLSADTIAALGGQPAGAGGWYQKACYDDANGQTSGFGGPVWIAGAPPVVSPEVLARQARARLDLPGVVIRINPAGRQLVNLPVWLALDPASWGTRSATASVPGISVTATARPVRATWSTGDGTVVVCAGPGTAWTPGTEPMKASPDCGHVYRRSSASAPGGGFQVSVTVAWVVTWAGAGRAGTVPGLTTTGAVPITVQESQAVITG